MIRKDKKYKIEEVFDLLPDFVKEGKPIKEKVRKNLDGDIIKVTSQRLQTFYIKGIICSKCGLDASYFIKEKNKPYESYHLNLYGVNDKGEEILFTKDHILPASKGGKDDIKNYQTMCYNCNAEKGCRVGS